MQPGGPAMMNGAPAMPGGAPSAQPPAPGNLQQQYPSDATPDALLALRQILAGMLPAQRKVEMIRHGGVIAGAQVTEPDGRVRQFAFARNQEGRIAGAHPMDGPLPPSAIPRTAPVLTLQPAEVPRPRSALPRSSSAIPQSAKRTDVLRALGARRARDGNLYVPDPIRPGKYLMVKQAND